MRILIVALLLLAAPAGADDKTNARALQQQGIDLYKAKKYDDAIAALAKSYQLDAQFDTLYALAQAERLGGHCPEAIPHYTKILEQTSDPVLAAAVQNNMGLCVTGADRDKKQECAATQPAAPVVATKPPSNKLGISLLAGGSLFAGAAIGMFVAASNSQDAAGTAPTYDDYDRYTGRAGLERGLGYAFTGAAVVSINISVYVLMRKPAETSPTVSASYMSGTSSIFVQARW